MRPVFAAILLTALLFGPPAAEAGLSRSLARNAAESSAISFYAHKSWASDWKVGACKDEPDGRVRCDARVTGDRLVNCSDELPYTCTYVFHVCRFAVTVHEAGYARIGRIEDISCRARMHVGRP